MKTKLYIITVVIGIALLTIIGVSFAAISTTSVVPGKGQCGNQKWVKVFEATVSPVEYLIPYPTGTEFNPQIINPYLSASQLSDMINKGCSFKALVNYIVNLGPESLSSYTASFDCNRVEFVENVQKTSLQIFTCRSNTAELAKKDSAGVNGGTFQIIFQQGSATPHVITDAVSDAMGTLKLGLFARK